MGVSAGKHCLAALRGAVSAECVPWDRAGSRLWLPGPIGVHVLRAHCALNRVERDPTEGPLCC